MKATFAIVALFATAQAVKLEYEENERYPWGSPYSYAETQASNKEVAAAWKAIEEKKQDEEFEKIQKEKKDKEITDYVAKVQDWNADISNPEHNEFHPKHYTIVRDWRDKTNT